MPRLLPVVLAICFLIEPIYLIAVGILDPATPRLEEQHRSFAILLFLSAMIPALACTYSGKIHVAAYRSLFVIITIYSIFFAWSIYNSPGNSGVVNDGIVNDFLISGIFVMKGIAIGSFWLRKSVVPSILKSLSAISIVISLLYIVILIQQIKAGLFYPGIGGATYQKASYIIAQLVVLNFLVYFVFETFV